MARDYFYPHEMPAKSRSEVRRQLIRGVWGSGREWREACELARDSGWTEAEVSRILTWYHPATYVWILLGLALVAGAVLGGR